MHIVRVIEQDQFKIVGKICDRCHREAREVDAGTLLELQEFVTITVEPGYGAEHFRDGEVLRADFCERCANALLARYLRLVARPEQIWAHLSSRLLTVELGDSRAKD